MLLCTLAFVLHANETIDKYYTRGCNVYVVIRVFNIPFETGLAVSMTSRSLSDSPFQLSTEPGQWIVPL